MYTTEEVEAELITPASFKPNNGFIGFIVVLDDNGTAEHSGLGRGNIILSHHRLNSSKPNRSDKNLITKTFEICERLNFIEKDYAYALNILNK